MSGMCVEEKEINVSSAKRREILNKFSEISLTYTQNSRGPRTEPWVTPVFIDLEITMFTITDCFRLLKYSAKQLMSGSEIPSFRNLKCKFLCHTLSNVFDISQNTIQRFCLVSKNETILVVHFKQLMCSQMTTKNPDCFSYRKLLDGGSYNHVYRCIFL